MMILNDRLYKGNYVFTGFYQTVITCMWFFAFTEHKFFFLFPPFSLCVSHTGWPRKNAIPTINYFKKTRDKINKLCALWKITARSLILMKVFWFYGRFSEAMSFSKFATSVSKSGNWRIKNFPLLASLGKVSALALKNEGSMNKEKHSLCNSAVIYMLKQWYYFAYRAWSWHIMSAASLVYILSQ